MYIPEIILTIIILALGLWLYHKDEKHKSEIHNLKEECKNEKSAALQELNTSLKEFYQNEISELQSKLLKLEQGTLVNELENENKSLKESIISAEENHNEKLQEIQKIYDGEIEETFNKCYEGLKAIENTLKKLNAPYDLNRVIDYHKSLTSMCQCEIVENEHLTEEVEFLLEADN